MQKAWRTFWFLCYITPSIMPFHIACRLIIHLAGAPLGCLLLFLVSGLPAYSSLAVSMVAGICKPSEPFANFDDCGRRELMVLHDGWLLEPLD